LNDRREMGPPSWNRSENNVGRARGYIRPVRAARERVYQIDTVKNGNVEGGNELTTPSTIGLDICPSASVL